MDGQLESFGALPRSEHFNWNSDSEYFSWKSFYRKQMQWIQETRSLDSFFLLYILQNDWWFLSFQLMYMQH